MKEPPPGAFDYLLKDIDRERRVPLHDLVRDVPPPRRDEPEHRRTHITIELVPVVRPRPTRARRWGHVLAVWLFVLLILATLAHGQPVEWRTHQEGFMTRMEGTDAAGRQWTGTSYQQGHMTYFDATGPDGQMAHCSAYRQGFNIITRCD